jgi:hypothetical protein
VLLELVHLELANVDMQASLTRLIDPSYMSLVTGLWESIGNTLTQDLLHGKQRSRSRSVLPKIPIEDDQL